VAISKLLQTNLLCKNLILIL
jgi:hypothetical protein